MKLLVITQKVDQKDQLLGFFIDWLVLFAERFEEITVLCLEKGEFNLPENVKVISLGKEENNFQFPIFKKIRYLLRFYKHIWHEKNDYDAVFAHMNPIWVVLGGCWWRMMKKRIFFWYTSGGVTAKLRLAEKFANVVFTASLESFRLPSKKVIITGHGIDTELFKPSDKKQATGNNVLKILSVGRISPVKNYEILIEAAKIFKKTRKDFLVTIVGEAGLIENGGYELRIKNKIKEHGLENNFYFTGKIEHKNLPRYYQSHDLFVHLSKTGSLDKTLLEAMACGMNVLSSNDAARSFLRKEMILKEGDPKDLADKIIGLQNKKYSEELRNYVLENHDLGRLINKISKIMAN